MESLRTSSLPHCRHRNEGAETGVLLERLAKALGVKAANLIVEK
jgi:hypothetical protein